jgi:acetyl esterase/lipase
VLALSPVTDMHFEKYGAFERRGRGNPLADASVVIFERACYLPRWADWENPYASPMLGPLTDLPPNLAFAERCQQAGVPTTLYFRPDMPHAFHTHHDVLGAEAGAANTAIVPFLRVG